MESKSSRLFAEVQQLKKQLLSVKLITAEESVGKTVSRVLDRWIDGYNNSRHHIMVVYTDNTALYYDGEYFSTYPIIEDSSCDYNSCLQKVQCWAEFREFTFWMEEENYIDIDAANNYLEKVKEWRRAEYEEDLQEQIANKEEEINKLKEML